MNNVIYNAAELWQRETNLPSIPTFSQKLDKIFGNDGIQLGSITELIGLPGTGKTQLCLQLCASVQIPKSLGGLDSEALYIDTNTNFTLSRFREILNASLHKCNQLAPSSSNCTEEEALKRLHYVNAFGLEKFCAFIQYLPKFILEHPKVKLIAIDSIVFPYKDGISTKQRTGLLFRQMAELQRIAVDKQIAVVVTNEMSTRLGLTWGSTVGALGDAWAHRSNKRLLITADNNTRLAVVVTNEMSTRLGLTWDNTVGALGDAWAHRSNKRLLLTADNNTRLAVVVTNEMSTRLGLTTGSTVGALGDAWAHRSNKRLLLTADNNTRLAVIMKSNDSKSAVAEFQITNSGIRDVE